jgi:hypothetical protein
MLDDVEITYSDESGGSTDDPGCRLPTGSREARTAGGEGDSGCGANKDGDDVEPSEDAMKLVVPQADPRREIDGADQESEDSGKCMRDEEMAVGDNLKTVGVVHGVIGDEKNF